jgi:hypothetical protein
VYSQADAKRQQTAHREYLRARPIQTGSAHLYGDVAASPIGIKLSVFNGKKTTTDLDRNGFEASLRT